jgi:ABC-type uncharacterized transport system auxiliary subunit
LLSAITLGGCASSAAPEDQFFRLSVEPAKAVGAGKPLPGTLGVARFRAEGLTGSRAIIYSDADQPLMLRQYHYHFWVEPPPLLVRDELVSYLRAARAAERVMAADAGPAPDYLVEGRVVRFEHVRAKGGATAVIGIELRLKHGMRGEAEMTKEYTRSVRVDGPGMHAVARAFNLALGEIFEAFLVDIRG